MACNRTVIGAQPPRGQQTDFNYFNKTDPRVRAFLDDVQKEMLDAGSAMSVFHNEVAPSQYELSPIFKLTNVAADENSMCMEILEDVASSREIFASKSPSLIVIAIGATTERLMRKACDSLGITRKHNARPTLHTYINEYQTKKSLNEKTHTQLNLIKEFRNRATHHFNIEWDESFIVLNQFCQFVEWYASSHSE